MVQWKGHSEKNSTMIWGWSSFSRDTGIKNSADIINVLKVDRPITLLVLLRQTDLNIVLETAKRGQIPE